MIDNKSVSNWLRVAGKKPSVTGWCTDEEFELWYKLMLEELEETRTAHYTSNQEEFIDGPIDLLVVTFNLVYLSGLDHLTEEAFNKVMNANWDKFTKSEEEAKESVAAYKEQGVDAHYEKVDEWYVIKRADGKILKRKGWTAPKHTSIV